MARVSHGDEGGQSSDLVSQRVWDVGQYVRQAIADELTRAVETGEDPRSVADRLEARLGPNGDLATPAKTLVRVSIVDHIQSKANENDPDVVEGAVALRRELVGDDHPRAARIERVLAGKIAREIMRFAEAARRDLRLPSAVPPPTRTPRGTRERSGAPQDGATPRTGKGESERRTIEAMVCHPKGARDAWIARCGNAARGCRGELGRFEDADAERALRGDEAYAPFPPEMRPAGRWVLRSAHGYGGSSERGFRVLKAPTRGSRAEKMGRSPLPERFGNVGGRLDFVGRWRGFVGQLPQPPCPVECPTCRELNHVTAPPVD